ncbi:MAG: polysulfide reductase NrfD [Thaumarchaeota archaeon]|nr:polysulfide reductase NrfD [Nitrososphaerota archaeon]
MLPLQKTGVNFYLFVAALAAIVGWGLYAYSTQLKDGLATTGMRDLVSWGVYISNFVFFIGISHAGTLISAILRVTNADWRRPVTRMAEAITVMALMIGALFPIIDLGRPERMLNLLMYGRIDSPIVWDLISISTYLTGSMIYLYLPLIPDIAHYRDNLQNTSWWRKRLYRILSLGWKGTEEQKKNLERGISVMAIIIIPVAVSVHTVVSWIFGMTLRVGWRSSIFGPYFVVGAIFTGIASIIVAMAAFRKIYHLESYITYQHFKNLGLLLLVLDIAYIYFTINEYLTALYNATDSELHLLSALIFGPYSLDFWFFAVGGLIIPAVIIAVPATRTIGGLVIASILVNIALWFKRYVIVIPTMANPQLPIGWGQYAPTWVEWSITAASIAGFILLFTVFSKVFTIVSIWEVSEGAEGQPNAVGKGHKGGNA